MNVLFPSSFLFLFEFHSGAILTPSVNICANKCCMIIMFSYLVVNILIALMKLLLDFRWRERQKEKKELGRLCVLAAAFEFSMCLLDRGECNEISQ